MYKKTVLNHFFLLIAILCGNCVAMDTISINKGNALFTVTDKTVPLISVKYVAWAAKWKYARPKIKTQFIIEDAEYKGSSFTGISKKLDVAFSGTAKVLKNKTTWIYDWDNKKNHPNAIGFGLEFKLNLTSQSFSTRSENPILLANNEGWRWNMPSGKKIEVKFEPPLSKLYFEGNKKDKIRTFIFSEIQKESLQTKMTVTVSDDISFSPPPVLRYGNFDYSKWHKDILDRTTSPVDLSYLNSNDKPAGQHGYVTAKGDKFWFGDGTEARFWGANVQAYALFANSDELVKKHAKRLARLGFNLIRLHHHDSAWVNPNIFKKQKDNTIELSSSSFRKLDWWIKCLRDEGIYVWLDLHTGRNFTSKDGIENFKDFAKGKNRAQAKGFNYINDSVQLKMQQFNEAYLNHVNVYTKIAYKDDPAVLSVLITNENDLTRHFGNKFLPNKGTPIHHKIFTQRARQFSDSHDLSLKKSLQTWLMGESKLLMNDIEHEFNRKIIDHLKQLGVKSLIATTNSWGKMGLVSLPSLTDGDLIDVHTYGRTNEIMYNPRYRPGYLSWIGSSQVTGMPVSVSEWNVEWLPRDRYTAPLYMASIANLQGWDALMLYGYNQNKLGRAGSRGGNYSFWSDPAIAGLMPATALLFRQGHVSQAKKTYQLKLDDKHYFFKNHTPDTSKTIRTILESSRLTISIPATRALPWLQESTDDQSTEPENTITITDPGIDFIPDGQNFVESDTGELRRNWEQGIHTINTEKSQVASGWIGGEKIILGDTTFHINEKNAVIAVQSLENKAIKNSTRLFITAMARSKPADWKKLSFISEPVTGEISITAPAGLQFYPVSNTGKLRQPIPVIFENGQYLLKLTNEMKAHWIIAQPNSSPNST